MFTHSDDVNQRKCIVTTTHHSRCRRRRCPLTTVASRAQQTAEMWPMCHYVLVKRTINRCTKIVQPGLTELRASLVHQQQRHGNNKIVPCMMLHKRCRHRLDIQIGIRRKCLHRIQLVTRSQKHSDVLLRRAQHASQKQKLGLSNARIKPEQVSKRTSNKAHIALLIVRSHRRGQNKLSECIGEHASAALQRRAQEPVERVLIERMLMIQAHAQHNRKRKRRMRMSSIAIVLRSRKTHQHPNRADVHALHCFAHVDDVGIIGAQILAKQEMIAVIQNRELCHDNLFLARAQISR
mmetsp:Transcript_23486/g.37609  ORF Transcript_23486/g.37609 Transcript_23486/m.37609 type:complete len:294 (-) Transcript_23486:219-1100(-)